DVARRADRAALSGDDLDRDILRGDRTADHRLDDPLDHGGAADEPVLGVDVQDTMSARDDRTDLRITVDHRCIGEDPYRGAAHTAEPADAGGGFQDPAPDLIVAR